MNKVENLGTWLTKTEQYYKDLKKLEKSDSERNLEKVNVKISVEPESIVKCPVEGIETKKKSI